MQLMMEIQIFALAICVILTFGILVQHAIGDYKWRKVRKNLEARKIDWHNGHYIWPDINVKKNHIEDMPKKKKPYVHSIEDMPKKKKHYWNGIGK